VSRKTSNNVSTLRSNSLYLDTQKFGKEVLANFMNINTLSVHNLLNLLNSISDAYTKSSLPKNMQRYHNYNNNIDGVNRIGQYYPIGTQAIVPHDYSYKPFGDKVLDFDPNTGEFVTYPISEWRNKSLYSDGNTVSELKKLIPMGLELEIIYRGKGKQCEDCQFEDEDRDQHMETFCEDGDYCYSPDSFDIDKAKKEMFKFLAQLNLCFGAIGTKSHAVWICKNDSSVDLEFVSMPMTIRAFKAGLIIAKQKFNSFDRIADFAKAYYGPCGGHIHVDKDSFTNTYQYYAFLSMHYDNPKFIAAMAQRSVGSDNQWAYLYKPDDFARVVKYKMNSSSREAVNVTTNTVELRYFRSNLKVDRLLKNFELIQSLYSFTSAMTYQDIAKFKNNTLRYYLLYILEKRYIYPSLFNFLAIRNWIKGEKLIDTKLFQTVNGAFYEDSNIMIYQEENNRVRNDEAINRIMETLLQDNGGNE